MNLQPATKNGAEYLTYVLWAITPEGRTANLGEVLLNGTKSKLNVTTELQVFGLVVTAEPYYAVTQPSDLIVMENVVRADTKGKIEEIDAKYELLQRGQYQRLANALGLKLDRKMPLELYEARNAVQIARAVGADRFAAETFQKAEKSLAQAEAYQSRKAGKKPVTMTAREAVQTAEDARAIAVKRQEEDALAAERQQSVEREARAESATGSRAVRDGSRHPRSRSGADQGAGGIGAEREDAQSSEPQPTRARRSASTALKRKRARITAQAEADRLKRENDARMAAAAADADRLKAENEARVAAAKAELGSPEGRGGSSEAGERGAKGGQPGRTRQRRQAEGAVGSGEGGTANPAAEAVQRHSSDPRYGPWLDREHVGCPLRHRQVFVTAAGAREAGQGGRHRLRTSGSQAGRGRSHGQRRRR